MDSPDGNGPTRNGGERDALIQAVDAALAGRWNEAHDIAQRFEGGAAADWLHAVLHKIEGDAGNSRYWYRRAGRGFDDVTDATTELEAIRALLAR